ncbi:MAG: diaminopimelate decarboxylase, partial [Clostridiales Family XIII bacterium]|nr:diaminopimelate decarboxylase [Clostridiales Family XIII bacterium]
FGIRYTEGEVRRPYSYFIDPIMAEVTRFCQENSLTIPDIILEPGRSIVGDAGITLYTAGAVRDIPGVRKYVSIDGGMPDNIRPALYGARYEAIVANRADEPLDDVVTIAGKCCETGDRIIDDARLQTVQRGDIIAVFATGAYGFSMASNYNRLPIPAVVLVQDGASVEIVRRQTFDDMVAREISLREIFDNKVCAHI